MNRLIAMMKFTDILRTSPRDALDYILENGKVFTKDDLLHITKELLYSIDANLYVRNREVYNCIHEDAGIELDEIYEDEYKEMYDNDKTRNGKATC